MKENRPVNLDLTTISLPITAITSILHRVSGVAIFFGMALFIYLFDKSFSSEASFNEIKACIQGSLALRAAIWLVLTGLIYHAVAGVKHLIMDLGFGETLEGGKKMSSATLVIAVILVVLAGVWLW